MTFDNTVQSRTMDAPFSKYVIYSDGRVFSNNSHRFVATYMINSGYLALRLWANNKEYKFLVHRLVAQYFVPNPNNLDVVNHIDGNRLNNDYRNLEWTTQQRNLLHAQIKGLSGDRSVHPYMLLNIETGECYLFLSFKAALLYLGANPARYCYNETLRKAIKVYDPMMWHRVPHYPAWMIKEGVEYRIEDFEWID